MTRTGHAQARIIDRVGEAGVGGVVEGRGKGEVGQFRQRHRHPIGHRHRAPRMRQGAAVERQARDGHRDQPVAFHVGEAKGARANHQRHIFLRHHRVARGHRHVIDRIDRDVHDAHWSRPGPHH